MWFSALRSVFVVTFLCGVASSQTLSEEAPVRVDPCELQKDPLTYNHKLVSVRSRVTLAFEDFSISPTCSYPGRRGGVWLELGGDAGPQTMYCCGDHSWPKNEDIKIVGFAIPLKRDVNLEQFLRLLSAKRNRAPDGGPCYDCNYFRVWATLTGRFFAGGWDIAKEGQAFPQAGYGHLGCCSLLVIQEVTDVAGERIEITSGRQFSCRRRKWALVSDKATRARPVQEAADDAELWRTQDCLRVATEAVGMIAKEWNSLVPATTPEIYQDVSGKYERAKGSWVSSDLLLKYDIELRKLGELQPNLGRQLKEIWVPYSVKQEVCVPRK